MRRNGPLRKLVAGKFICDQNLERRAHLETCTSDRSALRLSQSILSNTQGIEMDRERLVVATYSAIPDMAIAWLYTLVSDDGWPGFVTAIAVIWSIQLVIAVKAAIGSTITFRMYGKRRLVQLELAYFRKNHFPRAQVNEHAAAFLDRLTNSPDEPIAVRLAACSELARLHHFESRGVLASMRAHSALDEAVDSYIG